MTKPLSGPPASTFVVRFWRERSREGAQWRGRIEHVQTGENAAFLDLDGLVEFFRRSGFMSDGEHSREGIEEDGRPEREGQI